MMPTIPEEYETTRTSREVRIESSSPPTPLTQRYDAESSTRQQGIESSVLQQVSLSTRSGPPTLLHNDARPPPSTVPTAAAANANIENEYEGVTRRPEDGVTPRGTGIDELLHSLLDRLDRQDARMTERLDAVIAAQEVSQNQIEQLQSYGGRIARPQSDEETMRPQRTPQEDRATRRARPASMIIGSAEERGHENRGRRSRNDERPLPSEEEDTDMRSREFEQLKTTMKDMSSKMHRVTSSAPDIEKVLEETQRSPFTPRISRVRIRHISKLKLENYEGLHDPRPFLTSVSIAIGRAHFLDEELDAGSCQLFVEHLSGAALTWFSRLEANSIDSYQGLTTSFLKNYGVFMQKGASNADLWTMAQTQKESLRAFIGRFKGVVTSVAIPDDAAIAALRNALWHESRFREDLVLNQPVTLPDALHRANRFIEMEEEKAAMAKRLAPAKAPPLRESIKVDHFEPRQHYDADYLRDDKGKSAATYYVGDSSSNPGKRWNKWERGTDPKTEQVYCEFHKSFGHSTDECRQLQNLLMARFKKGDLDIETNR